MDSKADVKAIMARFQADKTNDAEEPSPVMPGRQKTPLHSTLSSGPPPYAKKAVLESLSGSAASPVPKPSFLKTSASFSNAAGVEETAKTKVLATKFSTPKEDNGNSGKPLFRNRDLSQDAEPKTLAQKPPLHKPSSSSTLPESKHTFPKPPPGVTSTSKPPWVKDDSGSAPSNPSSRPPKIQQKSGNAILRFRLQSEEADSTNKAAVTQSSGLPSNFTIALGAFNKDRDKTPTQLDVGLKSAKTNQLPLEASKSTPPPKPPPSKKPSFTLSQTNSISGDTTPKCHPLPNVFALGVAPAKPNRPPTVNLDSFRRDAKSPIDASHPSNHSNSMIPTLPAQPLAPSLPPRHPGAIQPDLEEDYDDVGLMSNPPPLPSSSGHPSQRAEEEDGSDGDIDDRWEEAGGKKKKRLEAEKKEQKEREKKEQDARKKFKLVGPLEVMHKGKALVDSRGGKTDLTLKKGEWFDIIRVHGNPEGKWLGRSQNGSFGYLKNDTVEVDLDSWKQQQSQQKTDIYDDIDHVPEDTSSSGIKGQRVVLPPPPEEDEEIYDDIDDSNLVCRVPPPSQFTAEVNQDQTGAALDEDIYDDVDSQVLLPPPPVDSHPTLTALTKMEDIDPKRRKKFEKEEKEFRKKFKYEGEIQVLYQVTISPTLTNKRWTGKDLPIKPGETLDVIVKAVDDKLICRNDEGKFGTVSTGHIAMEDDIYDDIGDDCIYDNE